MEERINVRNVSTHLGELTAHITEPPTIVVGSNGGVSTPTNAHYFGDRRSEILSAGGQHGANAALWMSAYLTGAGLDYGVRTFSGITIFSVDTPMWRDESGIDSEGLTQDAITNASAYEYLLRDEIYQVIIEKKATFAEVDEHGNQIRGTRWQEWVTNYEYSPYESYGELETMDGLAGLTADGTPVVETTGPPVPYEKEKK